MSTVKVEIEPIFDSEDDLWFAGTRTGLPYGQWSQRGEFFAWPSPNGSTSLDCAEAYATKNLAATACSALNSMTTEQLHSLCPWYFEEQSV